MTAFRVQHVARGHEFDTIVLNAPDPVTACERAAVWASKNERAPVLLSDLALKPRSRIQQMTDADAFAIVGIEERRAC